MIVKKPATQTLGALNATTAVLNVEDSDHITININGTWAGTIQFQCSANDGVTWYQLAMIVSTSTGRTTAVASTTANGIWVANFHGMLNFRAVMTAYTSGTASIDMYSSRVNK